MFWDRLASILLFLIKGETEGLHLLSKAQQTQESIANILADNLTEGGIFGKAVTQRL